MKATRLLLVVAASALTFACSTAEPTLPAAAASDPVGSTSLMGSGNDTQRDTVPQS